MTYKEVFEQLSDKQKDDVFFVCGVLKKLMDADANGEFEDVDEVEHAEEPEELEEPQEENALAHYGVLGMKWGVRKYQNPDGSLTAKGKKRYGEGGQYKYESRDTKSLSKQTSRLEKKIGKATESGNAKKAEKLAKKLEKKENRLKASKIMDEAYQNYAKTTSVGKAIAQNLIFGPFGARAYQQTRALGGSRGVSAAAGFASNILTGWAGFGNTIARQLTIYTKSGEDSIEL